MDQLDQEGLMKIWEMIKEFFTSFEGCAFLVVIAITIFLIVWIIAWLFLPFFVLSISSKVTDILVRLRNLKQDTKSCAEETKSCAEGVDRLGKEMVSITKRLERIGGQLERGEAMMAQAAGRPDQHKRVEEG